MVLIWLVKGYSGKEKYEKLLFFIFICYLNLINQSILNKAYSSGFNAYKHVLIYRTRFHIYDTQLS